MRLMKFVCAFAWADLKVQTAERDFVAELILRLGLDPGERLQVLAWLDVPPRPDEVDPTEIPPVQRKLFLELVRDVVHADGAVDAIERESLALLAALLESDEGPAEK
jgi:hypothetical protein